MQSEQDEEQVEEEPAPRRGFNVFLDKTHSVSSFRDEQSNVESVEAVELQSQAHEQPELVNYQPESEENVSNLEESNLSEQINEPLELVSAKASPKRTTPINTQKSIERPVSVAKFSQVIERPVSVAKSTQKIERPVSVAKSVQKIERPVSVTKTEKRSIGKSTTKKSVAPVTSPAKTPAKTSGRQHTSASGRKSVSPTPQVGKMKISPIIIPVSQAKQEKMK